MKIDRVNFVKKTTISTSAILVKKKTYFVSISFSFNSNIQFAIILGFFIFSNGL